MIGLRYYLHIRYGKEVDRSPSIHEIYIKEATKCSAFASAKLVSPATDPTVFINDRGGINPSLVYVV